MGKVEQFEKDHVPDEVAGIVTPASVEDEVAAMQAIVDSFEALDAAARRRVLDWARSRFHVDPPATEAFVEFMHDLLRAVGEHQDATKQVRGVDRDLWERTIKGTRYWTEEPDSDGA